MCRLPLGRVCLAVLCTLACLAGIVGLSTGYPNGPLHYVTDTAPYCGGCHMSLEREAMRGCDEDLISSYMADEIHYREIREGLKDYEKLSAKERKQLLEDVKMMDQHASVTLDIPQTASPGEVITATVTTRGGADPHVGIQLVDIVHRFQGRAVSAAGWEIVGPPKVIGPDGEEQTAWLERRLPDLARNINFVLVFGTEADLSTATFSTTQVIFSLKAPSRPGSYPVAAVFLFGTEKASAVGRVKKIGNDMPLGGKGGHSGRLLFSTPAIVQVADKP